jgi:hypothetical protein
VCPTTNGTFSRDRKIIITDFFRDSNPSQHPHPCTRACMHRLCRACVTLMDGFVKGEKPRFIESFPIAPKVLIADEKLNHLLPIAYCPLPIASFHFFSFGGQCLYFSFSIHKLCILPNSMAMFSLKTLYPGGIRTRVFCPWGGCDVNCATPPSFDTRLNSREWILHVLNGRNMYIITCYVYMLIIDIKVSMFPSL